MSMADPATWADPEAGPIADGRARALRPFDFGKSSVSCRRSCQSGPPVGTTA